MFPPVCFSLMVRWATSTSIVTMAQKHIEMQPGRIASVSKEDFEAMLHSSLLSHFPTTLVDQAMLTQHQAILGLCSCSSFSKSQGLATRTPRKSFTTGASESHSPPLLKTTLGIYEDLRLNATKVSGLTPKWHQKLAADQSAWMWHQNFYCHQCSKSDWSMEAPAYGNHSEQQDKFSVFTPKLLWHEGWHGLALICVGKSCWN